MNSPIDPKSSNFASNSRFEHFLQVAEQAARAGGQILVDWMGRAEVSEKRPGDYVTQADLESQRAISQILQNHFSDHAFLGEEQDADSDTQTSLLDADYCWIVDPLDGTTNYIHQLRSFSVSVALVCQGELTVGAVFDPLLDEMYLAARDTHSTLNGQVIHTSKKSNLDQSLLICSFPTRVTTDSPEYKRFTNLLCNSNVTLRRLGSAALNLCYVACGRADGYWATSVNCWDVAAGALLVQQAGGSVRNLVGEPLELHDPKFVAAATEPLRAELSDKLAV